MPGIAKENKGKTVLAIYIAAKKVLLTLIANKTKRISFKSGCAVTVQAWW